MTGLLTYLLPLKASAPQHELTPYLLWLSRHVHVVVVDGSEPGVFSVHHAMWSVWVHHVPVDPDLVSPMGKVGGVLTGMRHATHRKVVIADDDVRYTTDGLARLERLLDEAEVVRPQNYFAPMPWHARWDTARSLIARALGGDWPGTLGVDRDMLREAGGYRGDVMFENLELTRTIEEAGGRHLVAHDLFVERLPPTTSHFWSQRIRQAYDEFARPTHLAVALLVVPAVVVGRARAAALIGTASVVVAEVGRRRSRGAAVFPASAALWAPLWTAERAVTAWLAVGQRIRGGVRYGAVRLPAAASSRRWLRRSEVSPDFHAPSS